MWFRQFFVLLDYFARTKVWSLLFEIFALPAIQKRIQYYIFWKRDFFKHKHKNDKKPVFKCVKWFPLQWNRNRLFFSLVFHSFVTISNSLLLYNDDIFLVAELLTPNLCYHRFNKKVQIIGNLTTKLKIVARWESSVSIIVITSANFNFQVTQIWNVICSKLLFGKMYIKWTS